MNNTRAVSVMLAAACLLFSATDFTAEGKRWWSHIEYLASDELKGRLRRLERMVRDQ